MMSRENNNHASTTKKLLTRIQLSRKTKCIETIHFIFLITSDTDIYCCCSANSVRSFGQEMAIYYSNYTITATPTTTNSYIFRLKMFFFKICRWKSINQLISNDQQLNWISNMNNKLSRQLIPFTKKNYATEINNKQ